MILLLENIKNKERTVIVKCFVNRLFAFPKIILMITDIIICTSIDLDEISSSATFLCDADFDFFMFKVT